ncbi:MAG TPA: hypothetical protein VKS98_09835 [Chthoniobacterales bacterium]|nr:hypothetical protein [Chthoniobacterales bacterium]
MKTTFVSLWAITSTFGCLIATLLVSGCATSGGKPTYSKALTFDARVISGDKVSAEVAAAGPKVVLTTADKERFSQKIEVAIRTRAPQGARSARNYRVVVALQRYERGSQFARMMLAGLGQMHIDATITLYSMPAKTAAGSFKIDKTFSWGGAVGGMATIENVEDDFAKAVAEAVCAPKPKQH